MQKVQRRHREFRKLSPFAVAQNVLSSDAMDKPYDLRDGSFQFACDIIAFARIVADRGFIMSRLAVQLVKAGTSIGANLEEGKDGQTKPDFITKHCIALKESRETRYWLRLIAASEKALQPATRPLIAEASEFVAMLTASVKTSRSSSNRGEAQS
jgi:four helix bundle protein